MGNVYHRGYLPRDCQDIVGAQTKKLLRQGEITQEAADLRRLRKSVWDTARRGEGYLLQRRHGPFDYEYLLLPVGWRNPRRNHR